MKARWFVYSLLGAVPLTIVAWYLNSYGAHSGQLTFWIFGLALVSVVPLAALLGQITEILETYLGERLGGLLGASFGNVPEIAIGIALLIHAHSHTGAPQLVQADLDIIHALLIGSVINNVLFVLGSSIFFGAVRNGRMRFSAESAAGYASMLALAVVGLALPKIASTVSEVKPDEIPSLEINMTIPFAIVLLLSYLAYILSTVFKFGHRPHPSKRERRELTEKKASHSPVTVDGALVLGHDAANETEVEKIVAEEEATEDDEDLAELESRRALRRQHPYALPIALVSLAAVTLATVIIAGLLVSVTDRAIVESPILTPLSVGLVIFPIVCNLGEQAGAMINAWHNRMEGAMAVAAGSSVQVALFVTPVLALASFLLASGSSNLILTLSFEPLLLIVIGLVAFVYALVSLDGETTWLEGLQLLAFYAMIVTVAFVRPGL